MSDRTHFIFKNGISYSNLQNGAEFEIDPDAFESSSEEEYFDDEISKSYKDEIAKICSGVYDIDLSSLSFDELKEKMTPLTDDKLVLKLTLKPGTGPEIPAKSVVSIHYNAFVEGKDEPFDSTYRRGRPYRCLFKSNRLILGLDIGVSTMKKGEVSKFWIHSDYAYGPMGCPPRIPPACNVIYEVELLSYIDSSAAVEFEEMDPDNQRTAPFSQVYEVCKVEHQAGNEMFNSKAYTAALSRYHRARKLLEPISVENEEQDKKRQSLLLKLYLNLAIVYYVQKQPRRVLYHARRALEIDSNNVKGLFYIGRGHVLENEFERAREFYEKALKLEPFNEDIVKEIKKLDLQMKQYIASEKNFCQNIFKSSSVRPERKKDITASESPEFVQVIRERIERFKNSSDLEYTFAPTYTPVQIEIIQSIARSLDCYFIEKTYQGQKLIKIRKKC